MARKVRLTVPSQADAARAVLNNVKGVTEFRLSPLKAQAKVRFGTDANAPQSA